MKKLMMLLAFMLAAAPAMAMTWGELYGDVRDQTKIKILEGASAGYFYSLEKGSDETSQGGFISHVFGYRFLNADLGWKNTLAGGSIGTGVGGASVSFDKLVALTFPNYTQFVRGFVPNSAEKFWDALYVGGYTGWDFDKGAFDYGLHSGLELKF